MSGPPTRTLLDLLEPGWRRHLASGEPAGTLDVEPEMLDAAAKALGDLSRSEPPTVLNRRWPACVVVAVAQVTAHHDKNGKVWPAWHRAAGSRATKRSTADWAEAFLGSLAALGVPAPAGDLRATVLAHAAVTAPSLPEFLRLAGAGAPEQELADLDPAVAALLRLRAGAGFIERCRALMELLIGKDEPCAGDLADLSLPRRIIDAARTVTAAHPGPRGGPPLRRLPAGEVRWRVEVRRAGSGRVLGAAKASGDRWDPQRLWDRAPRPVLGELVVTVTALDTAPVTGLRRVVAVAEGLDVGYVPALRLTGKEGLEAAEAVLSTTPGMTASPCAATIPAEVTGTEVACVAGPAVLPLRVTPPHCRIRIEPEPGSGDGPTAWHSLGPLPLETADLIRGGALRLDLPGAAGDPPVDVVAARGVVQVLEPAKGAGIRCGGCWTRCAPTVARSCGSPSARGPR